MNVKKVIFSAIKIVIEALPYALMISIIFSIGGVTQEIFYSFFISDEVNLYDTLNQGQLVILKSGFIDWFKAYYYPAFILPSLAVVIFGIKNRKAKSAFLISSLLIFLTLSLSDIFLCDCMEERNNLLVSIISNFIGSPIISIIVLISIDVGVSIVSYFRITHYYLRKLTTYLALLIISMLIVFFVYFVNKNIYTVTSSSIDLLAKIPANGFYSINKKQERKDIKHFGLFSDPSPRVENFKWTGKAKDFSLNWESQSRRYDVEVRVLDGCLHDNKVIAKELSSRPSYIIKNINYVNLTFDDGYGELNFIPSNKNEGFISVSNEAKEMFTISNSKVSGFDLTRFISDKNIITHSSWEDGVSYAITLTSIDSSGLENTFKFKDREVTIKAGGDFLSIKLSVNSELKTNEKIVCRSIRESELNTFKLESIVGGLILTLRNSKLEDKRFEELNYKNETKIKGASVWFYISEVKKDDVHKYVTEGELTSLAIRSPIQDFFIDKRKYEKSSSTNDVYMTNAKLSGTITDSGLLGFRGKSNAIYVDGHRENKSRWEKMDIGFKFFILSLVPGIVFFWTSPKTLDTP